MTCDRTWRREHDTYQFVVKTGNIAELGEEFKNFKSYFIQNAQGIMKMKKTAELNFG